MKSNILLIALLSAMALTSGCSLFKKKCDCPKFNYLPPVEQSLEGNDCA